MHRGKRGVLNSIMDNVSKVVNTVGKHVNREKWYQAVEALAATARVVWRYCSAEFFIMHLPYHNESGNGSYREADSVLMWVEVEENGMILSSVLGRQLATERDLNLQAVKEGIRGGCEITHYLRSYLADEISNAVHSITAA